MAETPFTIPLEPTTSSPPKPIQELPKEEETPPLEFPFEIKDDLFIDFGNTSKYPLQQKPSTSRHHPSDPLDEEFYQNNLKELTAVMSHDWSMEAEVSAIVLRVDNMSTRISCQI